MKKCLILVFIIIGFSGLRAQDMQVFTRLNTAVPTIYNFVISVNEDIPVKSEIILVFPSEFDLSQISIADSRVLNGGLDVSTNLDSVIIKRSGLGDVIDSGTKTDLKIGLITNPADLEKEYRFGLVVRQADRILVDDEIAVDIEKRN